MKLLITFIAGFLFAASLSNRPSYASPCGAELRVDFYNKGRYARKMVFNSFFRMDHLGPKINGEFDADSISVRIVYPERIKFKKKQ